MAFLRLRNLSVEFSLYQGASRSLKKSLIAKTKLGNLARDARHRLVWKTRLEFAQRSCPCHWAPPRARRRWPAATPLYIIWGSLGQRNKPLSEGCAAIARRQR